MSSAVSAQVSEHVIEAQEAKLHAGVPNNKALFGHAVALEGSLAVVGAPLDDTVSGTDAGAAYVYQRSGSRWTEVALLVGSAASELDLVGKSVDISGDVIVVGSHLDDPNGINAAGSAYVFVACGGGWIEACRLTHPNPAVGDQFGFRVRVDGNTIVVGSPGDDTTAVDAGSIQVFERDDGGTPTNPCDDVWVFSTELLPSVCQATAAFGASIDMQGDRIVAGAPDEDCPDPNGGTAYVFERQAGTWSQTARLLNTDISADDEFGGIVALDGDTLLVASMLDDEPQVDRGSVCAYTRVSGTWTFQQKFTSSDGAAVDYFGMDLALHGDVAVVGAPGDDDGGDAAGAAYVFRRNGSVWSQESKITACDAIGGEDFGCSVAFDGNTVLIGSQRDDSSLANSGTAAVFLLSTGHFERFGFGDGTGTPCPCSNDSVRGLGQGCKNSSGWGGKLSLAGTSAASSDDLRVIVWNLLPANPALLFTGPIALNGGAGVVFGNGLRLVGGSIVRRGVLAPDQQGRAIWGPGLGASSPWISDTTVHFQAWYRDPFPYGCVSSFNLTNGISVTFQP
jgi:hypothetical protein